MKKNYAFLLSMLFVSMNFAQVSDTLKVENERFDFRYKKLYVPAALMLSGIITDSNGKESLKNEIVEGRNEHLFGFKNHLDDYAQFFPFAAIYGFEIAGMKPRTDWKNRTAILIKGQIVNLGLVYILKKSLHETRPDGTAYSFPSGHTANVFAGATMLSIEYGEDYKWVPYVAYGTATAVGVMRMANNKHYISDVLFGAGLGILSMKAAYWTHQYKWNRPKSEQDPLAILYTFPEK
ncbi:phosphatase PAP2 family protein [Kaistella flava (ex Peng et al. 2021)]|uniref:Phosphatase PAP2 family protein n=1 Tax=Kaistella flava (ex Peng et al. 2021) TaxID=2038776 RepID=A0A7M2YBX5_9FLAO|nr:phosphatase PAP2 family protein [Kaistella flava (ex Peng et al. 2021)]QOW11757.1 phosphatase PAP2 family protein [Kaistella flava (ex Peng et al. 2021)]